MVKKTQIPKAYRETCLNSYCGHVEDTVRGLGVYR